MPSSLPSGIFHVTVAVDSEDSMWGLCQWNLVLMSSSVYTCWCRQLLLSHCLLEAFRAAFFRCYVRCKMSGHQAGGGVPITQMCDNNPEGRAMTQCSFCETNYVSFVGYLHSRIIGFSHMKLPRYRCTRLRNHVHEGYLRMQPGLAFLVCIAR